MSNTEMREAKVILISILSFCTFFVSSLVAYCMLTQYVYLTEYGNYIDGHKLVCVFEVL